MDCITSFFSVSLIISIAVMIGSYFAPNGLESRRFDAAWGAGVIAITLFTFFYDASFAPKKVLITLLSIMSSLRLAVYLFYRCEEEENPRYVFLKNMLGNGLLVFLVQAVLVWLVSFPMIYVNSGADGEFGILCYMGTFFWLIGFAYEAIADYQLNKFLADKNNVGQVLRTGLWKYSRHPNYFGQLLISWGLWFFAAPHFKAIISPVVIYLLLKKYAGIPAVEKRMLEKIPSYQDYIKNTNQLVPWWPDDHWG